MPNISLEAVDQTLSSFKYNAVFCDVIVKKSAHHKLMSKKCTIQKRLNLRNYLVLSTCRQLCLHRICNTKTLKCHLFSLVFYLETFDYHEIIYPRFVPPDKPGGNSKYSAKNVLKILHL